MFLILIYVLNGCLNSGCGYITIPNRGIILFCHQRNFTLKLFKSLHTYCSMCCKQSQEACFHFPVLKGWLPALGSQRQLHEQSWHKFTVLLAGTDVASLSPSLLLALVLCSCSVSQSGEPLQIKSTPKKWKLLFSCISIPLEFTVQS